MGRPFISLGFNLALKSKAIVESREPTSEAAKEAQIDSNRPMEFAVEEEGRAFSPNCSTLLLPALSIGNVGQLAVDLLVSSLGARRVGYLDDPSLLPCVGNDAYGPVANGDLSLPLEAYESPSHALGLIQQRSPLLKGMMVAYARNLAEFICSIGKKHVIILSSLDAGRRKKIDASSHLQVYYVSSINSDGTNSDCEKLGLKKFEEYDPTQRRWKYLDRLAKGDFSLEDMLSDEDELIDEDYYPGLPFAALFSCFKAKCLQVTCLLCYCSEGDNISDSFQLAEAACKLLGLNLGNFHGHGRSEWIIPLSWRSVYGPPPDMSIF